MPQQLLHLTLELLITEIPHARPPDLRLLALSFSKLDQPHDCLQRLQDHPAAWAPGRSSLDMIDPSAAQVIEATKLFHHRCGQRRNARDGDSRAAQVSSEIGELLAPASCCSPSHVPGKATPAFVMPLLTVSSSPPEFRGWLPETTFSADHRIDCGDHASVPRLANKSQGPHAERQLHNRENCPPHSRYCSRWPRISKAIAWHHPPGTVQTRRLNRPVNGSKRLGFKADGPRGNRRWVLDLDEYSIMGEIVRLRDEKGMTWQEVSDSIEKRLCELDGREFSQSVFFPRKWRWDKCRRGYQAFKQIMAEPAQGASGEADAASGG